MPSLGASAAKDKTLSLALEVASAHDIGAVLRFALRANRPGHAAAEASLGQASDEGVCGAPLTPSSLSEDMNGGAEKAETWLRIDLESGRLSEHPQPFRLAFDTGREEKALAHLKLYFAWFVNWARGRCEGCVKVREENKQMLTCGGKQVKPVVILRELTCACAQMPTCTCLTH